MRSLNKLVVMATLAMFLSLSLGACSKSEPSLIEGHPWIGQAAPLFSLERYASEAETGDVVSLRDLRGHFVVIHFATSW